MCVYDPEAFEERVNYAASVISKGIVPVNGRHFDTCFEMFDGDYVVAALVRRTLHNPNSKLAQNLFQFLTRDSAIQHYEETKHLTRAELRQRAVEYAASTREARDKS